MTANPASVDTQLLPEEALLRSQKELADIKFALPSEGISLDEAELSFVQQAIERSGGNQTRAAELLGISRDQLRYRLKKLDEARGLTAGSEGASS